MAKLGHLLNTLADIAVAPCERATILRPEFYTSPEVLALEVKHVFAVEWQCPGRTVDIPQPGDYISYEVRRRTDFHGARQGPFGPHLLKHLAPHQRVADGVREVAE